MNQNTIELIDFIDLLHIDSVLSEKERKAIVKKAQSLGIGTEETEVIIEQFTTDPQSVRSAILQFKSEIGIVNGSSSNTKKRASQELNLSLPSEKGSIEKDGSFLELSNLSYDEVYRRSVKSLIHKGTDIEVKTLKEIENEILDLKKKSKSGSEVSDGMEKRKIERRAIFQTWTNLLYAFTFIWTYFSLIGLKSDWISICVGVGFSLIFVILINVMFSGLIDGYVNNEIELLEDKVDDLSAFDDEIQAKIKQLNAMKLAVSNSLKDQKEFNELLNSRRSFLETIPFYESGCNEIIRQTEISDSDMQKIITNCLFIKDSVKKEVVELNKYLKNQSKSGLPSSIVFKTIEKKTSEINVYMTLLNGYCYSLQSLSERTQFEHFLSENLINLSKKEKIQIQGMKKMINQLSNINKNVTGLSNEILMIRDSISNVENTVSMLEYSMDDMRYSVDDIRYDIADSQNSNSK